MTSHVVILGDSDTRLWGLSGRQRLQRQLQGLDGITVVEDAGRVPTGRAVLILKGDHVYDARLLPALLRAEREFVLESGAGPAAARVGAAAAAKVCAALENGAGDTVLSGYPRLHPGDLGAGYDQALKKNEPLLLRPIRPGNRSELEAELFAGSYKGVTDLVTKWVWPRPARHATRLCVRLGLKPNHVTLTGMLLAILAGVAFWYGYLGSGLVLAWLMTFLDTVDGKLARVTVTASRFGDILDHGVDLIHPPLWYLAWGVGLEAWGLPVTHLSEWMWFLFLAYLGGRLCEGAFELLAHFGMFIWRRLDSFNRLITARRNPNLILLTASLLAGRPDLGFYGVAVWHGVSTLILALRLMAAWRARRRGPLHSWLAEVDPVADRSDAAVRLFTRGSAGQAARD